MTTKRVIDQKLAALAERIIDEASEPDVKLEMRVDAFKALSVYNLGVSRLKAKDPAEDPDTPSFGKFRKSIAAVK